MKKTLSPAWRRSLCCLAFAGAVGAFMLGGIWASLMFASASVLAMLTVCTVRTPQDKENVFDRRKKASILLATVTGCLLVISCCYASFSAGISEAVNARFAQADLFDYYTAQLSLTFISISVMSVLSDKSVIIYWANVSEDRLIRPTFYCFAAYTYYSIGATVGAGLGVFLDNAALFVAFFAADVIVMILLTISMIDVYYGRDTKKKALAKTLVPFTDQAVYENKILALEHNLLKAADDKDIVFLREVYELCVEHPGKFATPIGQEAMGMMVSTLNAQTTGPFLRALDHRICEDLMRFPLKKDNLVRGYTAVYDSDLWTALNSEHAAAFLEQVCLTDEGYASPNSLLFAKILMHRLTLNYNACAAMMIANRLRNGADVDPALYFVTCNFVNTVYEPVTADGAPLPKARFCEVMDFAKQSNGYDTALYAQMVRLMDRVLKNGHHWFHDRQFAALPFVEQWVNDAPHLYDRQALARLKVHFDGNT